MIVQRRRLGFLLLAALAAGLVAAPAQTSPAERSTSPVVALPVFAPVEGASSTLVRTESGLSARFQTAGLPAGEAFTVWFIVFNEPGACTAPIVGVSRCGEPDLFNPAALGGAFTMGGHVVGSGGPATIAGSLHVGDMRNALTFGPGAPPAFPNALTNPMGAEVILVLLRHGPWLPGSPEQFKTFWACNLPPGPGATPFGCREIQASVHQPTA
jgi:hypothetical protein